MPFDLYDRLKRASAQAYGCGYPNETLISDHTRFRGFSILHCDYEGNQPSIRKICEIQLSSRLVEHQAVG